jgi:glycosyltransferase involved in cell wall biosynthesis
VNIWLVSRNEPAPISKNVRKMRTAILADKLLERSHSVFWWTSAFSHRQKIAIANEDINFDISERYTIRVLKSTKYKKNISLSRYIDHQITALKFRFQAKKFPKPDFIVISTPDHLLAYQAARYASKNEIPFLVDIRDLWPDIFLNRFKRNAWLYRMGKAVLAFDFARLTFLLKHADALVAVSQGYLNWGLDKIGRKKTTFDDVFYIGYKISKSINSDLFIPYWLKGREGQKIFLFIGTFGISYEIELIIDVAERFERAGKTDICFVIAGSGEKFSLISKKSIGLNNIVLPGWVEADEVATLLRLAYVGLVPCRSVENTVPNKPFEYLSAGLPIISSLEGEMAMLINQHKLGFNYLPGDIEGLYKSIKYISSDSSLHNNLSKNALNFFNRYGDANNIYNAYSELIESLT